MKFKKLLILVLLAGLLVILSLIKNSAQKKQRLEEEKEPISLYSLTQDISESFVSKIIIYKGSDENNKIVLSKNPQDPWWAVENKFGVKAKKEIIDALFKDLPNLKGELRAASRSIFGDFALGDSEGVHLVLETTAGKPLTHLVMSYKKPSWGKSFIRTQESEKVVLVAKDLLPNLGLYAKESKLEANYFIDLKIIDLVSANIKKIQVSQGAPQAFTLLRLEKTEKDKAVTVTWNFEPNQPEAQIDPSKVNEFLSALTPLYAQDVVDPKLTTYGFDTPQIEILLEDSQNQKPLQITVGSVVPSQKTYYIKASPSATVFTIPETALTNLKKDKSFFLKEKETQKKQK